MPVNDPWVKEYSANNPERVEEPINQTIGELINRVREKAKTEKRWIEVAADLTKAGAKSYELEKETSLEVFPADAQE